MRTIKQGAAVGLIVALASICRVPAGPDLVEVPAPAVVNMDLPPEEPPDPERLQEEEQARQAIHFPEEIHSLILQLLPTRRAEEVLATLAILHPDAFERANPKGPDRLRAEGAAAQAILNPHWESNLPGIGN